VGTVHDISDALHERRIVALRQKCAQAMRDGSAGEALRAWDELKAAVLSRSEAQVERMEQSIYTKAGAR
jgi:hypothetical protein